MGGGTGASTTNRNLIQPGESVLLIVEDDITFARILVELGSRSRVEGAGSAPRKQRHVPGPRIQAGRDHAGYRSSGYGGVDYLGPPEARTRHAPHPGSHHFWDENRRRGLALGRHDLPGEVGREGLARRGF